ncbi:MAG: NHLP family bacteriocin export ABC transporter peptidase/permease/ATPase subunit [Gemmatimonadales bacterium]|nr:NHLP family bacteriocin export ABC transporter peptidase/permease/ATPase subunit [Gemmatimonadales bacterium]MDG2239594.1 NHLP family bacteriocin export ABC transporter peptidase/permease/ATPase subunit [Longimicrobiales bacterium]MBT3500300.1 NHLP family bacteriocin export ABC transporter peptidase/permease/ATPase subunit [Gemmatimonadales bacterium]MBT3773379.1 NHLP family bacteriocin export ABC transporter peptidase/permease/ATPase subunit [Gemmatimonadales bacterium]MBT3957669.1 NHLP fam
MSLRDQVRAFLGRRPNKTRTLLQMEAVECGAAALGSVLGYYGRVVSLEELRTACGVSRDGVTAKNIIRAARSYGLEVKGYRSEIAGLEENTTLPAVLFWNFNHFLVLEGFDEDRVFLNDPATGPRTVTRAELDEGFTGVVLTFERGPDFVEEGSEPSLIQALKGRLAGSETAVLYAILAGLALVFPGLIVPTFSRVFVDQILIQRLDSWVVPLLTGMALTAVLRGVLTWLQSYYLLRLKTKLSVAHSGRFFWHVLRLPIEFYSQRYAGEVSHRVQLNDGVAALLSGKLASTAIDLVMIVFFGALMFMYDWALTLLAIFIVSFNLLAMKLVSAQRIDGNRRLLQEHGKYEGALMGSLRNIETLKATSREADLFSKLAGYQAKLENASQDLSIKTQVLQLAPSLLTGIGNAAVLGFGGYRIMQGDLTMGMLVAFQSLQQSFVGPVTNLLGLGAKLQEMVGDMTRLDDVLRYPADPQVSTGLEASETDHAAEKLTGRVELKNLTFGYSRLADPLISDFSLTLEPGARVALVGASGCGKSTISKLVARLYEPWSGEILLDGTPLSDVPRAVFTSSLAFVDQDLTLFEGSIRENLLMWDETVPDLHVIQAAKDAMIHDAIVERPGGYDSKLKEEGSNFSGGQRQRLDIARALCGNPRILVLDEATSALDAVTEKQIDENIRRRGCTCIIVAHRLSTIRDCDEIIVLDGGRVVQRGTHEALVADGDGWYTQLLSSEAG